MRPNSSVNASEGHRGYKRKKVNWLSWKKLPAGVCAVLCGNAKNLPCLPKEKRQYPDIQRVKSKGKRIVCPIRVRSMECLEDVVTKHLTSFAAVSCLSSSACCLAGPADHGGVQYSTDHVLNRTEHSKADGSGNQTNDVRVQASSNSGIGTCDLEMVRRPHPSTKSECERHDPSRRLEEQFREAVRHQ